MALHLAVRVEAEVGDGGEGIENEFFGMLELFSPEDLEQ